MSPADSPSAARAAAPPYPLPWSRWRLSLSCPEGDGVEPQISEFLARRGSRLVESAQFGTDGDGAFFMRVVFDLPAAPSRRGPESPGEGGALMQAFAPLALRHGMRWQLTSAAAEPRLGVLVSRAGHHLDNLLYRRRIGRLDADVARIITTDPRHADAGMWQDVPVSHLDPERMADRAPGALEAEIDRLAADETLDLMVLAGFAPPLSARFCDRHRGRLIHVQSSFMTADGADLAGHAHPWREAWRRGLKLIGATASYVTAPRGDAHGYDGAIIEQEVERIDHQATPEEMRAIGEDIECLVLARALRWHIEQRTFLHDGRTVVFR